MDPSGSPLPGSHASPARKVLVELRGVRRTYAKPGGGRVVALELPRLEVPAGTLQALVGANGTGKTTLLHLAAGLLRPDTGVVRIGGVDLASMKESVLDRYRAHNIGYLLQGAELVSCLTAEENVLAAQLFAGRSPKRQRARAAELLERFGVAHRARHLPAALSGGERQRVALARALANRPPLLLADEPLASLDHEATARLVSLFRNLVDDDGLTVLVATHQPERLQPDGVLELGATAAAERGQGS